MEKLKIEYVDIDSIKPYERNAKKHPQNQIEQIKSSIEKFGMDDPIGVWKNEVVEGHGRLIACKELGMKEIPIIRLDHLTDEERKAYMLIHNKINMNSGFDVDILNEELENIIDIDMSEFDFNIDEDDFKENERHRTNDTYNLDLIDIESSTNDFWQMPIIQNNNYIPKDLIGFNYAKSSKEKNVGIHFYLDDYQFERLWNNPSEYIDVLSEYDCILSPDFSLYMDMPMPMKIWNVYRSRQIGQYYQSQGIRVIPTLSWAEKETFEFAFKGIPKGNKASVQHLERPNAYSIHNHPTKVLNAKIKGAYGNAPSAPDLRNWALGKGKGTIVVASENRTMYIMSKSNGFKGKELVKGMKSAKSTGAKNYDKDVDKWLKSNQKKYGYKYTKTKF